MQDAMKACTDIGCRAIVINESMNILFAMIMYVF